MCANRLIKDIIKQRLDSFLRVQSLFFLMWFLGRARYGFSRLKTAYSEQEKWGQVLH